MKELDQYSKETDVAVVRSLFGAIPIVGGLLNEIVFDIRGRIKQERLNKFTDLLAEYFVNNPDFDRDTLKTEDFSDLFESVIKRVLQTRSETRYKRYRDILVNQIEIGISNIDNSERYLDLISNLNEVEISILFHHKVFDDDYKVEQEDISSLRQEHDNLKLRLKEEIKLSQLGHASNMGGVKNEIKFLLEEIDMLERDKLHWELYREFSYYKITDTEFIYYKQNLYSKALLIDSGIGTYGYVPFARMSITEFGKEFLQFLTK